MDPYLRDFWERHAQHDPLWAVLSDETKKGRRWRLDAFFETGTREISLLFYKLRQLGIEPRRDRALDFGCGVGRLSRALADLFDEVVGVDISPTMIKLARLLNPSETRVSYVENQADHLRAVSGAFSFIYSNIVLQHIRPEQSVRYLAEFFRVAAPGAVVVFQLPSHRRDPNQRHHAARAMPEVAYRQSLRIDHTAPLPTVLTPGQEATVRVTIRNVSNTSWIQSEVGAIRLGNHWLGPDGVRMLIQDDGRTLMPEQVRPGEIVTLLLQIRAPEEPGRFLCEVDLVHEGVTWFRDRGAETVRFPVDVRPADRTGELRPPDPLSRSLTGKRVVDLDMNAFYHALPTMADDAPGEFPMFGVHFDAVETIIREAGARLAYREVDERAGPEWVAYRYFVCARS